MTPEEFQQIKEAEKEHLRALKKLKQAVRGLEQRNKVTKAVTDIATSTGSLLDEHTNLIEKLAQETALQEARLEIAMETAAQRAADSETSEKTDVDMTQINEDLAKRRASDLVRQMKSQMGSGDLVDRKSEIVPEPGQAVDKTIGRRRTQDTIESGEQDKPEAPSTDGATPPSPEVIKPAESDVPEKTIGRMKRDK